MISEKIKKYDFRIPGIKGYVDRDVFYKNYVVEEPSDNGEIYEKTVIKDNL